MDKETRVNAVQLIVPALVLGVNLTYLGLWEGVGMPRDYLFAACLTGFIVLFASTIVSFGVCTKSPSYSLYLAGVYFFMLAPGQAATHVDAWQFAFGCISLGGGAGMLIIAVAGAIAAAIMRWRGRPRP